MYEYELLINETFEGENTIELRDAMLSLHIDKSVDVDDVLMDVARQRSILYETVCVQYAQYQSLKQGAAEQSYDTGKIIFPLNTQIHPRYMGSRTQLRYGRIVGDALGIDAVFGALLNPTGGLVGMENKGVDLGNSPLSYHSTAHDAGGYLLNYHGIGLGYDYLGLESPLDPNSVLTGQASGLRYWYRLMNKRGVMPTLGRFAKWLQKMSQTSAYPQV